MRQTIVKTLLLGLMLAGGASSVWGENTMQEFGSESATSWTTSSSTTNIKFGSTVTLNGLVMTFGGSTYTTQQTTNSSTFSEDFWTWNSSNGGVVPGFMPNTGNTSSGVTSIAVGDALPTNGAVYKFELSKSGTLTIDGKGGTTKGKIVLLQANNDNKVTAVLRQDAATNTTVTTTYSLEAGTYYFFQLCEGASNVNGYRYTLKSIQFETLEPVEGLQVWNFEESGWKSVSTTSPLGVMQDQLWLSGSITYDATQTRYNIAAGKSNQIRFKVKKGQKGYVVIVAKGTSSSTGIQYGLGSKANVDNTSKVCAGSIYKVYTSTFVTCDADKDVLIHTDGNIGYIKKIAWVPNATSSTALASVTLGTAGFSTFCPTATVNIPTGLKAYILNSCSGTTATWNEITGKVPAFTGVLLVGEGGTQYDFYCPSSSSSAIDGIVATGPTAAWYSTASTQQNILVGTYKTTSIPASDATTSYYGLKKNTNTFGLVSANVDMPAGMAYFSVATAEVKELHEFIFDLSGATAIHMTEQAKPQNNQPFYTLSGMRVSGNPASGIYVKGGKKVIIK